MCCSSSCYGYFKKVEKKMKKKSKALVEPFVSRRNERDIYSNFTQELQHEDVDE